MRVCINGSRNLTNVQLVHAAMRLAEHSGIKPTSIVSGGARGVDTSAKMYAMESGLDFVQIDANWKQYGKSAGYRRNMQMLEVSDALVSVWDGESTGTKHLIDAMHAAHKPVYVYFRRLHIIRLVGHPYTLTEKITGKFTAFNVIDVHRVLPKLPSRDAENKLAVVIPQENAMHSVLHETSNPGLMQQSWGYFKQKFDTWDTDYRL